MSSTIPQSVTDDKPSILTFLLSTLVLLPAQRLLALLLPLVAGVLEATLSPAHSESSFEDFEDHLHTALTKLGRFTLERRLIRQAQTQPDTIEVNGVTHRAVSWGTIDIYHPYGSLNLPQRRYRPQGVRGTKGTSSIGLLQAQLGLIHRSTPRLARIQARFDAEAPSRLAVEMMELCGVVPPSRSRQDRWGRRVADEFADALPAVAQQVRVDTNAPTHTAHMLVSLDRFCLTMHEQAPGRPFSDATVRYRAKVPHKRTPPEGFELKGRMVYAACITFYDEVGGVLGTYRYGLPHDEDPRSLVAQLRKDIQWVRSTNPSATLDICLDGACDLWKVMQQGLIGLEGPEPGAVVDWYHFWERTHRVLSVLWEQGEQEAWRKRLLCEDGAIGALVEAMYLRVAEIHSQVVYDDVERFEGYVTAREGLFDYATQRQQERCLGSGSMESSCKQIGARMRRCGQRWKAKGARGRLALRAAFCSGPARDMNLPQMERAELLWKRFAARFRHDVSILALTS